MRQLMHYATRTYASLAIVMLPTLALAQTPSRAQPNPAAEHLSAARSALNKVLNAPAPSGDAFKKLTELKTHYIALEKAASTASPEWSTHYTAIDRLVGELIGAPASAEPGAVGTSGVKGALDPGIAANLQEFRTHLTAFNAAMSAATSAPTPAAQPTQPTPAAASASAPTPATPAAPSAPAQTGESSLVAQLDQVTALVDSTLAANAQITSGTISIERATLEQIKAQLDQIKERVRKP